MDHPVRTNKRANALSPTRYLTTANKSQLFLLPAFSLKIGCQSMSSNNQNIIILFQAGACEFYFRCLFILQRKTFQEVPADQSRFPDSKDIKVIRQLLLQYLSWLLICSWTSQHSEFCAQNSSSIFTFPSVHICFLCFLSSVCLFFCFFFSVCFEVCFA